MIETVFIRLRFILIGLGLLTAFVIVQLVRIDLSPDYFRKLSEGITQRPREFSPARGRIFDRNGELLATNDVQYEVGLSPAYVVRPQDVADTLSDVLDKSHADILQEAHSDKPYVLIARPINAQQGAEIKARAEAGMDLSGVDLDPIPHRVYPGGALAAQVLGFVAYNNEGRQAGYFGVEGFYNDLLAGRSVKGIQRLVPFEVEPDPTPDQGADLYLTIDRDIQYLVEMTMADAINQFGAEGGTILVMNPKTGEILGMSSWPTFNPNSYTDPPPTDPANPAVSGQYEPGSTFKILTMAAALDSGTVTPQTPFMDTGYIEVGGVGIRNWDNGAWGPVDMIGCMEHSLNVCMAHLSKEMGATTFYNYLSAFGIGHMTNVDLASETPGHLKRPGDSDWFDSDLGTNSFGQGVATTPLQLTAAIAAVANGGTAMQPHILLKVQRGDHVHVTQPQVVGRPIKPETAATLGDLLAQSLERGEGGENVLVPGYRIAGKTGTAQIPIPGGYHPTDSIASFIGWGPVDDPQFVVLIKLDRPATSIWGSETAAPLFGQMVKRLTVLMEIPPDAVRQQMQGQ